MRDTKTNCQCRGEANCRTCKLSREITGGNGLCPTHGSAAIALGDPPGVVRSGSVRDLEDNRD